MTNKPLLFGLVFLTLISCQGSQNKKTTSSDSDSLKSNDLIENPSKQITGLPPVLEKFKNQIPNLSLTEIFELNKESDDNLEQFLKLDSSQVDYFYSTDELRQYYAFFNFHSYYYGYNQSPTGLIKVFIINTNWETAIYLDCFILNSEGEILDFFRPAYIEVQPSYSYIGFGKFENDSNYYLTAIDSEIIDDINEIEVKNTKIMTVKITKFGKIISSTEKYDTDTIYSDNE